MNAAASERVLRRLADGQWHKLDDAAIAQDALARYGVTLEADDGRYRLSQALQLLDRKNIEQQLCASVRTRVAGLDVYAVIDSTNAQLQRRDAPQPGQTHICLAEYQNSGRGRRGKTWVAPFGSALCLSLSWCFLRPAQQLSALGLAVGVAVATALRQAGVAEVQLKWPNDLVVGNYKLGGILVEAQNAGSQRTSVVVGIGLNVVLDACTREAIANSGGLSAIDVASLNKDVAAARNSLAATVIDHTVTMLAAYAENGFECSRTDWLELNALAGLQINAETETENLTGEVIGIDDTGALLVRCGNDARRLLSADVTVRKS